MNAVSLRLLEILSLNVMVVHPFIVGRQSTSLCVAAVVASWEEPKNCV
jgi:hypothetical protein